MHAKCSEHGAGSIWLTVTREKYAAIALYLNAGFQIVGVSAEANQAWMGRP